MTIHCGRRVCQIQASVDFTEYEAFVKETTQSIGEIGRPNPVKWLVEFGNLVFYTELMKKGYDPSVS